MQELKSVGTFDVRITECLVKELDQTRKPGGFSLVLKCVTPDDFFTFYEMEFSNHAMPSGKNQGKKMWEINTDLLKDLGVADGYVGNVAKAIETGLAAVVVTKWEEWEDRKTGEKKKALRAKYLNPPKRLANINKLSKLDIDSMLKGMKEGAAPVKQDAPPPTEAPAADEGDLPDSADGTGDNIPF